MVDGVPNINIDIFLEGNIQSIQSGINYEEGENLKILEKAVAEFLKKK